MLSLAQLMDVLDGTIVNIALPSAQQDLAFSAENRAWVVNGYALAFASLLLLGGRLSDRFGRKRLFLIGLIGFASASAVGGAANGFTMLLAARIAQGVFAAALAPAALSLVSVTFADDPAQHGRAFAVFGAVSGMGGVVGLILGGLLTDALSWRWCLYINLFIAAVAFLGALVFVDDRPASSRKASLDAASAALIAAGLFGLVYGLTHAADHGWRSTDTMIPTLAGLAAIIGFVIRQGITGHPLLPLRVILDRDRGASLLAIGFAGIGSFALFLFLTYYLQETLGFSPLRSGLAFTPMVAMLIVGSAISGSLLLPRTGPRPLVPAGCLLAATSLALLTRIGAHSEYTTHVLPSLLLLGLGFGCIFSCAQNVATSKLEAQDTGVASATVSTIQQIGGAVGLAVFTSISASAIDSYLDARGGASGAASDQVLATLYSDHVVFWVAAAVFAAGAALTAMLYRSGPARLTRSSATA
ncbi:DHA2 family efflux MFS transporter permease subunit [Kineococcus rhizosphaerae]|uniref:EmrB/QacA subfamily drug resistance transporter n=1 Tax=Kineococcus rhizosphaerae TaxID=559628 RepID=A0A2T0QK65_9ACTN|nr:DHA2 family efflux MFS transporter permease subunit [Kineococcus rhizosphaerae]PRY04641.1 EmrB/QacA subfamily drug resistance transporter [Kineococcus rhizosphaerae]